MNFESSSTWDSVAADYNTQINNFTAIFARDLLLAVEPHLTSASSVLDVGCGTGAAARAYLSLFPAGFPAQVFTSCDFSPEMVDIAREEVTALVPEECRSEFRFQVEDGNMLDGIPDNSVDVVLTVFGVFFSNPHHRVFEQIRRVLKKGGIFANAAWTSLSPDVALSLEKFQETFSSVLAKLLSPKGDEGDHESKPQWKDWADPNDVRAILQTEGFTHIKMHRVIHSQTVQDLPSFWSAMGKLAGLTALDEDKLREVKNTAEKALGLQEGERTFSIMSSNLSVAKQGTD